MTGIDMDDWYVVGSWVTSNGEPLTQARSPEQADEIVRDHNVLAAEVRRLTALSESLRDERAELWPKAQVLSAVQANCDFWEARAAAAEQARDRWEREAQGMATECRDVSGIIAAALGYPDMHHTDAPLGVVISNWLAQEITSRLAASDTALARVREALLTGGQNASIRCAAALGIIVNLHEAAALDVPTGDQEER